MLVKKKITGFTLIEISIVLLIMGLLIGFGLTMLPKQYELRQYNEAKEEMQNMTDALYAFAQVNGYLPCPAVLDGADSSNGLECRDNVGTCDGTVAANNSCHDFYAFFPGKTLGLNGRYSTEGLLLDPWFEPYRYQVTDNSSGGDSGADFIIRGDIKAVGMATLSPNLVVCNADPSNASAGDDTTCADANLLTSEAPAVILSLGKNKDQDVAATSFIQRENLDNDNLDTVFVSTTFSDVDGAEYDDLVRWISPNILFSKMIEAGQLP